jgi:hypothetical protein
MRDSRNQNFKMSWPNSTLKNHLHLQLMNIDSNADPILGQGNQASSPGPKKNWDLTFLFLFKGII